MTKADLKLISNKPRTPSRQALAEAVAALRDAETKVTLSRTCVTRVQSLVEEAEARMASANLDVDRARNATTSKILEAAHSGGPLSPDRSGIDARARKMAAEDDLSSARAALAVADAHLAETERVIRNEYGLGARRRAEDAAKTVLSEEAVDVLIQDIADLQRQIIEKYSVALSLSVHEPNNRINSLISLRLWEQASRNHPAAKIWGDVLDRLLEDPDAALPL